MPVHLSRLSTAQLAYLVHKLLLGEDTRVLGLDRISEAFPSRAGQESKKYESAQFLLGDGVLKHNEVEKNEQTRSLPAIGSRNRNKLEKCGLGGDKGPFLRSSSKNTKILIIAPDLASADDIYSNLLFFFEGAHWNSRISLFERWDMLPFEALSPTAIASAGRVAALNNILTTSTHAVIAPIDALMQKLPPASVFRSGLLTIDRESPPDRSTIISHLQKVGYRKQSIVEEVGELAVRGAVLDFFSPGCLLPTRLEFQGDLLTSIRAFDPGSQRSTSMIECQTILPAREVFLPNTPLDNAEAVMRLRERASQINLTQKEVDPIMHALATHSSWPGLEHLQPLITPNTVSFADYIADDALVIFWDHMRIATNADDFESLCNEREKTARLEGTFFPALSASYLTSKEVLGSFYRNECLVINSVQLIDELASPPITISLSELNDLRSSLEQFRHSCQPLGPIVDELKKPKYRSSKIIFVSQNQSKAQKLQTILSGYDLPAQLSELSFLELQDVRSIRKAKSKLQECYIVTGFLSSGFHAPAEDLVLISERDLFPVPSRIRRIVSKKNTRRTLSGLLQLNVGDYVVHIDHGISMFKGIQDICVEGVINDYIHLEFAEKAKLYVPIESLSKISKFIGASGSEPALSRLGSRSWDNTKKNVQEKIAELAGQLVSLYARREVVTREAFGQVDESDLEFAETFPYEETADQEKAISDVLKDMSLDTPMDRLVCGDVGYGKTEVALRGAFKAVNSGKQVAVLVPTTILADQHFASFSERFANYPIEISCLNRFMGTKQNKLTLERLRQGKVDIIIGTHRLLQKDVSFHKLGLVIIDEEHRFGVAQKERLKRMRLEVDVLTLTATPIPRTLHMSLLGIRDMSVIETPPCDRQVTRTYVARYDEALVKDAIVRELSRQGQVFYIHNKVKNISHVAKDLTSLVPAARIEYAHGQMKERELEKIIHRFVQKEIDVLVCTTIVESGLDIPNANTIIICDADRFGLAELYQLRGRVGRGSRRAYAYLFVRDFRKVNEDAQKRLEVLQNLDDLGVGFRLALQDMEIRGAGNLLGKDQSGTVNLVGFELYTQILRDAIMSLRARGSLDNNQVFIGGEELEVPNIEPDMRLGFSAHIPTSYMPDVAERMLIFQRLVELNNEVEGEELLEEITDRFGPPPKEVGSLLQLMKLRSRLKQWRIISAIFAGHTLRLKFHSSVESRLDKLRAMVANSSGRLSLAPSLTLGVRIWDDQISSPDDIGEIIAKLMYEMR